MAAFLSSITSWSSNHHEWAFGCHKKIKVWIFLKPPPEVQTIMSEWVSMAWKLATVQNKVTTNLRDQNKNKGQNQLLRPIQMEYQYKWKVPDTKTKTNYWDQYKWNTNTNEKYLIQRPSPIKKNYWIYLIPRLSREVLLLCGFLLRPSHLVLYIQALPFCNCHWHCLYLPICLCKILSKPRFMCFQSKIKIHILAIFEQTPNI